MLLTIFICLVGIAVLIVLIVAKQPSTFRVQRCAVISASPETLFGLVNDFHKWEAWSPWAKLDPEAINTFEGEPSGTGATFRWEGNNQVGAGNMTIVESRPGEFIQIKIEFLKPFPGKNTVEFDFKPAGRQTEVSWSMHGNQSFMGKAFSLVVDCDKMIGGYYEKGLAQMKEVAEAAPAV